VNSLLTAILVGSLLLFGGPVVVDYVDEVNDGTTELGSHVEVFGERVKAFFVPNKTGFWQDRVSERFRELGYALSNDVPENVPLIRAQLNETIVSATETAERQETQAEVVSSLGLLRGLLQAGINYVSDFTANLTEETSREIQELSKEIYQRKFELQKEYEAELGEKQVLVDGMKVETLDKLSPELIRGIGADLNITEAGLVITDNYGSVVREYVIDLEKGEVRRGVSGSGLVARMTYAQLVELNKAIRENNWGRVQSLLLVYVGDDIPVSEVIPIIEYKFGFGFIGDFVGGVANGFQTYASGFIP